MSNRKKYDVAFSFAGEDRVYVEQVANELINKKISVFYDKFEEAELWGKNLYTHLIDIYQNKATYTVIFVSSDYAKKNWCNHELKSAQAKAFEENSDCILPAKFDDTVIDGILPTVGFIDLREKTPNEFAHLIYKKLTLDSAPQNPVIGYKEDLFFSKKKAFIDHLGNLNSVIINLGRTQNDNPMDMGNAWIKYNDFIIILDDFFARYQEPFLVEFEEGIQSLKQAININTDLLISAHNSENQKTFGNFQSILEISKKLKNDIYKNLTQEK